MTDGELLELAAKAAGRPDWDHAPYIASDEADSKPWWDPLTDDGDALRLAVKMDMDINIESAFGHTRANEFFEDHGTDPCAATRRAIVRAAAAMSTP